VLELRHPDLHWLVPISRPKAGDPEKQVEEAAESIGAVIDERRARPLYGPVDGMASHGVASVRLLQRAASLTAVEGGRRVFIIGDAERLVPQESSPEAANALLKLLEEPPAGSIFILTAVDPRRLLPTMRSRAVPVRLGRVTDEEVRGVLRAGSPEVSAADIDRRVAAAAGSIGAVAAEADDSAFIAARAVLEAALGGRGARMERALRQNPFSARGDFSAMLDAMTETLADAAWGALGEAPRREPSAALMARDPDALLRAIDHVSAAREAAFGNVNPQLLLAALSDELAETL
jgi:DNA polymerase-3 subunit delta'